MTGKKWESEAEIAARLRAITEELRMQRRSQFGPPFTRFQPKNSAADAVPRGKPRKQR